MNEILGVYCDVSQGALAPNKNFIFAVAKQFTDFLKSTLCTRSNHTLPIYNLQAKITSCTKSEFLYPQKVEKAVETWVVIFGN